ncbi:MAG: PAS domain S-box protein [Ignavibacteriae bacterium]|nr:MAG: PAS domain S-box protein [Ignavibacteriota bacterium]
MEEKKYINSIFVFALVVLIAVNIISYFQTKSHFDEEKSALHAITVIKVSESLLSQLIKTETSRNAYLITANDIFMVEYNTAVRHTDSILSELKKITSIDEKENKMVDTLVILIGSRRNIFEESIELQERKKDTKTQIDFTNRGKATQDRIAGIITRLQTTENENFIRQKKEAAESAGVTLSYQVAGSVFSFILLIIGIMVHNKFLKSRKKYETALEDSRNWFSTTLISIGEGVIVTNHIGDITFMNPVAEELTGWTIRDAKGVFYEHVFNIKYENPDKKLEHPIQTVFKQGKIVSYTNNTIILNKEGKAINIDCSASPIIARNNSLLGVVVIFKDISERRKYEMELIRNKMFIQKITNSTPNILYLYELSGPRLVYSNEIICKILGYTPDEIKTMNSRFLLKLMHKEDLKKLYNSYNKYISSKDIDVIEHVFRIKNKKGEWRWLKSFDVVFTRDNDGVPKQILGTAQDITDKKELEEQIKKYSEHLEELVEKRTSQLRLSNEKLQQQIFERIKAEKSMNQEQEKFRSLVEYSLVGIYIHHNDKFIYVNPKFEEMFGYKECELEGVNIYEVISNADKKMYVQNLEREDRHEEQVFEYPYSGKRKDGSVIDVEVRGTKIQYNDMDCVIGTVMDVTETRKALTELKESEEKFRIIAETASDGIITIDEENKIIFINKATEKIFGYEACELIGNDVTLIMPDVNKQNHKTSFEKFIRTGEKGIAWNGMTIKGLHKSGKEIPVEISFGQYAAAENRIFTGIIRDISERKKAEDEIKNQRKYLRSIIDANPNLIFAKDKEGRFTLVNKAVANMYGTDVKSLVGKKDSDFNSNKAEVEWFEKDDREVIETGKPKFIPEEQVTNTVINTPVWYQTIKVPLTIDDNIQVLGISTDITERKLAEEKIKKSLKEKELLLQEIHHRVKNNLQIIVSLLKMQSRYIHDKRDLEILNKSRARVETMSLIHEKLYRSKDLSNINLQNYIKDLTANLLKAYGIDQCAVEIKVNIEDINFGIDTAIPCGLIINELVSNSLKHAFRINQKGNIDIEFRREGNKIIMNYGDDGTGLLPDTDLLNGETLGTQLITTLVKQLDGTMNVTNTNKGLKYSFILNELKYKERFNQP